MGKLLVDGYDGYNEVRAPAAVNRVPSSVKCRQQRTRPRLVWTTEAMRWQRTTCSG
jgi:hypothetical protein